jgi:hypothetical protein
MGKRFAQFGSTLDLIFVENTEIFHSRRLLFHLAFIVNCI